MKKYLIKVAYDGTSFSGWQVQINARSIQEEIEKALSTVLRTSIKISGSGRTDQGVHAKEQVAHFEVENEINASKTLLSLNGILPQTIRIKELYLTHPDFHARFSAKAKIYHYHFWTEPVIDPILYPYRLHMRKPFCQKSVQEALLFFVGEKDFTTFANLRESNQKIQNAKRHLKRLELIEQEGGFRLEFEGDGFLYKMVRNIVGVLIEIGQKRRDKETIQDLFNALDRKAIGMPAPPHGLFLQKVIY